MKVEAVLEAVPSMFAGAMRADTCLGAAIRAAIDALKASTGGKLHVRANHGLAWPACSSCMHVPYLRLRKDRPKVSQLSPGAPLINKLVHPRSLMFDLVCVSCHWQKGLALLLICNEREFIL